MHKWFIKGEMVKYVKDERHNVIPWESVFSFEFQNATEYTLKVRKRQSSSFDSFTTVKSREIIQIQINTCGY